MSWERIKELRKRSSDLSASEERELEDLIDARTAEQKSLIVRPTCCEAAQKVPAISFVIDTVEGEALSGRWVLHTSSSFSSNFRRWHECEDIPDPKFCPYCGTELPKMVLRKEPFSAHICMITDGGYYCDTCEERLDSCICDPMEVLFEPEK